MTAHDQARAFGVAFRALAAVRRRQSHLDVVAAIDAVALRLWDAISECGFDPGDMGVDGSLGELGLAREAYEGNAAQWAVEYGPLARPKCGRMKFEITGNLTCMLPLHHDGACVYEEHGCADCGRHHGTCRECGATQGDSHARGCKWA